MLWQLERKGPRSRRGQTRAVFLNVDCNMADNLTCSWTGASGKMYIYEVTRATQ